MKWIGQQVYDYISRFRNDVYLEDISTGTIASGSNLGLDSNNKIVKADVPEDGDINRVQFTTSSGNATVSSGNADFTLSGTIPLTVSNSGTTITIAANDSTTSSKGIASFSSDNFAASSGAITIKDGGVDLTAEVTGVLPSANLDADTAHLSTDQTFTGTKTFDETISGSISGSAATVTGAAQTNITSLGTLTALDVDAINLNTRNITITGDTDDTFTIVTGVAGATTLTTHDEAGTAGHFEVAADGDITLDAAGDIALEAGGADISIAADHITFTSASAQDPQFKLISTTNDANGCQLQLRNNKGAAGADGDGIGSIRFIGDDAAQTQTEFGKIICQVSEADDTDEAGKIRFMVASSDGTTTALTNGLIIEGEHATASEVDVTIANGSASTTTVSGNLQVTTGIELGHASDTTIARSAAGKVTIESAPIQTTQMSMTHHHFFMNSSSTTVDFFFPYNNLNESSSTSQYYTRTIAPYDGKIVKVLIRPVSAIGTACKLQFHKITDTTAAFGTATEEVDSINLNTAQTSVSTAFSSATFDAGDVIGVSLIKSASGTSNVQAVIVWEYTV